MSNHRRATPRASRISACLSFTIFPLPIRRLPLRAFSELFAKTLPAPGPKRRAWQGLSLMVAMTPLHAQEHARMLDAITVTAERPSYRAGPTRTATKTDTPPLRVPQNVQVVPRTVIDDQAALSPLDAVRNVAGTGADFGFDGGSSPLMIVRSFPAVSMSAQGPTTTSIYLDGSKVQGVPVAMADVASVEVLKGPASVLYGRAEPGGIVNVVTRRPQAERVLRLSQAFGVFDLSRTSVEAVGALDAAARWQGRAALSYDDNGDSDRDFVVDRLASASAALAFVPDGDTTATLSLVHSRARYRTDYGVPAISDRPVDIDRGNQFNEGQPLSQDDNTRLRFDLSQRLSPAWRLDVRVLGLRQSGDHYALVPTTFFSGQETLLTTGRIDRFYNYDLGRERDLHQVNADLVGRVDSGRLAHTLLLGVDTYRDRFDSRVTGFVPGPSIDIRDPDYGNAPPLDLDAGTLFPREGLTRWTGVYAQDQIAFGNGVELLLGVRYDRTRARFGDPSLEDNRQTSTTPRAGLVWQFARTQSVYAQYQKALAANNGRNLAGEALDPERGELVEVGYKWQDERLAATAALYRLSKKSIANAVLDDSGFFDTLAIGQARSRGLEIDIAGELSDTLSLIASYAYTDAEVTRDAAFEGKRLPNVPRHAGSLWLRWAPAGAWTFGGGVFAQDQRAGDQGDTFQLAGYGRVDLMAAYRFALGSADTQLQLNAQNVFDRRYYAGSHQHVTDWIQPGTRRSLLATLRIDY